MLYNMRKNLHLPANLHYLVPRNQAYPSNLKSFPMRLFLIYYFKTREIRLFLIAFLLIISNIAVAQEMSFVFDNAGNRVDRVITLEPQKNKSRAGGNYLTEEIAEKRIKIYPNPTEGNLKIEICGYTDDISYSLEVFGTNGQLIYHSFPQSSVTEIDLTDHSSGVYLLKIGVGKSFSTWKVIKK